jgi:hypothetical protein
VTPSERFRTRPLFCAVMAVRSGMRRGEQDEDRSLSYGNVHAPHQLESAWRFAVIGVRRTPERRNTATLGARPHIAVDDNSVFEGSVRLCRANAAAHAGACRR